MNQHDQKQLQIAIKILCEAIPNLFAIVLFGSYGTEYETDQSDLDLALLSKSKLDILDIWRLAQTLAIEINRDVDLIDLGSASTVFRFQVLSTGTLIYCSNQKDFDFFENTSFAMYQNFQETRKEILKDYLERKTHCG